MSEQTDADLLADLLVRWEDAWDQGEDLSAAELCGDRTDLVESLQKNIASLKQSAWMKRDPASLDCQGHDEPPLTGTLAGRYRIENLIGEGGHGRVHKAYDQELERTVAIKVASAVKPTPDLLDEARRVAKLRHPNLVAVHDVGRQDDQLFVVSDYIEGKTLAAVIERDELSLTERISLIAAVADALGYAHENGFVHRDIKPSNILIDENGSPHVADFGIATSLDDLTSGRASSSGTLAYMSPEQLAAESQLIDQRTDLYALGVVLFETLTGKLPYKARTPLALREQILFRPAMSLREAMPTASSELEALCNRSFAKHPSDRFQNADEFARSLRSCKLTTRRIFPWKPLGLVCVGFCICCVLVASWWAWNSKATDNFVQDGVLHFDGRTRIVTNVNRTLPVTLEAWVKPDPYRDENCQFIIGSDIPGEYGLGIAICGSMLSVEYVEGMVNSTAAIPPNRWSHVAAVFSEDETRLYLNGKLVETASGSTLGGETRFVIGNVGETNLISFYSGQIRSVRISAGEQYTGEFKTKELQSNESTLVLIDGSATIQSGELVDASGQMVGRIESY